MTDHIDIEALARRAIACTHWRWLRGMVAFYPDRRTEDVRAVVVKDASDCLHGEQMVCVETGITSFKWDPVDGWLPDLTDPATLGGLLALVRKAYREPRLAACGFASPVPAGCWQVRDPDHPNNLTGFRSAGASEAEALVSALEAAPR